MLGVFRTKGGLLAVLRGDSIWYPPRRLSLNYLILLNLRTRGMVNTDVSFQLQPESSER